MAYVERLKAILAKVEGTYKTDSIPVITTDGIQIEENIWSNIEIGFLEENLRDNLAQVGMGRAGLGHPEGQYGHVTCTAVLKGCGAAYASGTVAPESSMLFRMAGFKETFDATPGSETVTYTFRTSGHESGSVYAYSSGSLYKLVGCRAQLTELSIIPSQLIRATFDIWGVVKASGGITDAAQPTVTYPYITVSPPTVKNSGLTLNAFDPDDFYSFTLEPNTALATLPHGNDADGHGGYEITDFDPHLSISMDKAALSSFNPYTLRQAGTLFAWDIGPIGPAQYNKVAISGPKGRIVDHPHGTQDGLATWDLSIRCQHTDEETADDAVSIVFS